jgi:hypothetical protein
MIFKDEWIDDSHMGSGRERAKQVFKFLQKESAHRIGVAISEKYGFRKNDQKSSNGEDVYKMEVIVISPKRYAEFIDNLREMDLSKNTLNLIKAYLHQMDKPDQPL